MLTKLIYPTDKICYFCRELSNKIEDYLCPECRLRIEIINSYRHIKSDYLKGVYSSLLYTSITKDLLHRFKFEEGSYLFRPLAQIMSNTITNRDIKGIDLIIPVPLHRRREAIRGYNQSYLLAKEIGRITELEVKNKILIKSTGTRSQSRLNFNDRLINLNGVFNIRNRQEIKNKNILLIDDIVTTGATLIECSKILHEAGARSITGLTLTTTSTMGIEKQ